MPSGESGRDGAFPALDPRRLYSTSGACSVSPFTTMVRPGRDIIPAGPHGPVGPLRLPATRCDTPSLRPFTPHCTTGRVVDGDPSRAQEVTEFWTFRRSRGGTWMLSAIQQV